jgi:hypothetical protein
MSHLPESQLLIWVSRVTRLGEFSPIEQLFALFSLLKITEAGHVWATFSQRESYVLILTILGDFFLESILRISFGQNFHPKLSSVML